VFARQTEDFFRTLLPIWELSDILVEVVFRRSAEKKVGMALAIRLVTLLGWGKQNFLRQAARSSKASTPVRQFFKFPRILVQAEFAIVSPACAKTAFEAG